MMLSALGNKREQRPLLGMEPQDSIQAGTDLGSCIRQITERPETIGYRETEDPGREVENSNLGQTTSVGKSLVSFLNATLMQLVKG